MAGLDVCPRCGWYLNKYGPHAECTDERQQLGEDVGRLAHAVCASTGILATKLGYGDLKVTFNFSKDLNLQLEVARARGRTVFRLRDLFCLYDLDHDDVKELLEAIAGTRIGQRAKAARKKASR